MIPKRFLRLTKPHWFMPTPHFLCLIKPNYFLYSDGPKFSNNSEKIKHLLKTIPIQL